MMVIIAEAHRLLWRSETGCEEEKRQVSIEEKDKKSKDEADR